jgi:putative endonuclease
MYIVYVIINREKCKTYTGQTNDLEKRMLRHNGHTPSKTTLFTKKYAGIWEVLHQEHFSTREDAVRRERELKSYQGRKFIKKMYNV